MLPIKSYKLSISDIENDILKKTILSHQKRWEVGIPEKWKDFAKAASNIKYITAEQWGQHAPLLTFETLMYNYVYPKIDEFILEHYPDRAGEPYHTDHCWYMIYVGDGNQVPHNHLENNGVKSADYCCSGSYYVEIPWDGYRVFNIYDKSPRDNNGGEIINVIHPQEKQLLLFDSGLWHEAIQRDTKNRSITIAFNAHFIS